jgi:DinB superfamily
VPRLSRSAAIDTLEEGRAKVEALLSAVPDVQLARQGTIGDGEWSAKDLIGHVATWEELALRSLREFQDGTLPWVERPEGVFSAPATGKVDALNARTVAEKRGMSLGEVRDQADSIHRDLIKAIEGLNDLEWNAKAFYPTPNNRRRHLSTLIGSILGAPGGPFQHAFAHLSDLETFVRSVGRS